MTSLINRVVIRINIGGGFISSWRLIFQSFTFKVQAIPTRAFEAVAASFDTVASHCPTLSV